MRMKLVWSWAAAALCAVTVFIACQKEIEWSEGPKPPVTPPDLSSRINSSVSGFVTDENNAPVQNAMVKAGTITVTTDEYGYFQVRNTSVVKNAATVTVTKSGYYKAIKTYTATENKSAFFRIKLIANTTSGTINAASGGSLTLLNGFKVTLPANAVVNAATNAAYTGTVNVAAYWIDPTGTEVANIMPGDLRGLDKDSVLRFLASFGMANVELTGSAGEKLQVAPGKKANLSFPIPASLSTKAPANIPLWYFDETLGLWREDGSATKTGNNYVGDVSHFTLWNVDDPEDFVLYDCTVVNTNGQPVPYVYVKVTDGYFYTYGYTDSTGFVTGYVPKNASLTLQVFDNSTCSSPVYSQSFSTTTVNISLGTITIPVATSRIATLTGTVKNCSGGAVTNGFIIISDGNILNRYNLSATGTYSVNKLFCAFPSTLTLIGEDVAANEQSNPVTYMVTGPGTNAVADIIACGIQTQEFFTFTDNGGPPITFSMPVDTMTWFAVPPPGPATATIVGNRVPFQQTDYVSMTMGNQNVVVGSVVNISAFSHFPSASFMLNPGGTATITEYGAIGQFVAGTFSVSKNDLTTGQTHTYAGSFRVRRSN